MEVNNMDSLNKLTNNKLNILINSFIKLHENNEIDICDIENICRHVWWNGYNKGANDGYDTGYLDGRDPGDYKKGW
jgi:hypothetical protein